MQIHGKITMCEVREGVSERTGSEWKMANYVIVYDGHYSNGTSCQRSLKFDVFGRDRLNKLRIIKDQVGTLDIETTTRTATSRAGNSYIENVFDILGWTPDAESAPTPAPTAAAAPTPATQSNMGLQSAPAQGNAANSNDDLPF